MSHNPAVVIFGQHVHFNMAVEDQALEVRFRFWSVWLSGFAEVTELWIRLSERVVMTPRHCSLQARPRQLFEQ